MTEKIWVAVITAIIGPVLIIAIKKFVESRSPEKRSQRTLNALKDLGDLYVSIGTLRVEIGAARIVLLMAENNGGLPKPGCQVYSSVVHEVFGDGERSIKADWFRRPVDGEYAKILSKLVESADGAVSLRWETMPNSPLRDFYESHGIVASRVYEIGAKNNAYYYISCTWTEEPKEGDADYRNSIRMHLQKIRSLTGVKKVKFERSGI